MLNRMTLRQFLALVFAKIQASMLLADPQVADAIEQYPDDKIAIAIRMARSAIAVKGNEKAEHDSFEAVFAYMNKSFNPSGASETDVKAVLDNPENLKRDFLDEEELRRLVEAIVPIAVAREMIRKHRVRLDLKHAPAFDVFADVYGDLIMGSSRPERSIAQGPFSSSP